jgi:hypothetical protein
MSGTGESPKGAVRDRGAVVVQKCAVCGRRCKRTFCSAEHATAYHNLRAVRGRALYDQAMRWRRYRSPGGFSAICRLLDAWLAEDREMGRAHYAPTPVHLTADCLPSQPGRTRKTNG